MAYQMVSTAQTLTSLISTYTDADTVAKAIRTLAYSAGDPPDELNPTEQREAKIDQFVQETLAVVVEMQPHTGLVRLDAREKFIKQLRKVGIYEG